MLYSPAWSPDGQWIAFVSGAQILKMPFDVLTEEFDTSAIVSLTTEGLNSFPAWSPDGEWIAYRRSYSYPEPHTVMGIWLVSSHGGNQRRLVGGIDPAWSPDGHRIMYVGWWGEVFAASVTVPLDTIQLTFFNQDNPYSTVIRSPEYSPDGNSVVFTKLCNGLDTLWMMAVEGLGRAMRSLYAAGVDVNSGPPFSFSPGGRWLAFASYSRRNDAWHCSNGTNGRSISFRAMSGS